MGDAGQIEAVWASASAFRLTSFFAFWFGNLGAVQAMVGVRPFMPRP